MSFINQLEMKQYLGNALDCVEFKLIRNRSEIDDNTATSFHPEFAHQIFGENECIFGYKDLKIRLFYTAGPLNIYMGLKYTSRIEDIQSDGLKSDDVTGDISKLLTTGCYYTNIDEFLKKLDKEESFVPFGEKIFSWDIEQDNNTRRTFEIYECSVKTPGFLAYHARLQTFLLWFVDAASYIDTTDDQWMFFVAYEKYTSTSNGNTQYATVGYSTVYTYYAYPQNIRPRISQMLVLPPFQSMGIGAQIIETIYNKFNRDDKVVDITVEDPSDDFRRVRNFVDAKLCYALPEFAPEKLKEGFSKEMIEAAKQKYKINPKQCRIVYEILRLKATNVNDPDEYTAYRLCVKKRLNVPHHKQKEDLKKMEKRGVDVTTTAATIPSTEERICQLKEEYEAHEEEYYRIINRLKLRAH
ncbi:histone acetyltransferase type B catalytic subunit [Sitodiplosis mosellana]|uniref:histone acetyltransferase type B catalytic subunit n=1 Tax=Sitodiplosis mosellana TaxID=263140 RepID=UPI0024450729|nr:histone acetyltransferase type B catalytic subunit [Sitodiplosis mosellana]